MRIKIIAPVFLSLLFFVSCNVKTERLEEESLWDESPQQFQPIMSDTKIQLSTVISPPPPGNTDPSDTTSVIMPEKVSPSDKIHGAMEVDFLPVYPDGGWKSFSDYIQSLRYPREVKDKDIEGALTVSFVVEKDGSVSNVEIRKSVDALVDEEIVKALKSMPAWKPAQKDGLYVRSKYGFTLIYD